MTGCGSGNDRINSTKYSRTCKDSESIAWFKIFISWSKRSVNNWSNPIELICFLKSCKLSSVTEMMSYSVLEYLGWPTVTIEFVRMLVLPS